MGSSQLKKHAVVIGIFAVVLYAVCLLWRLTITDLAVNSLHLLLLKLAFPGFKGMDAASFLLGAVYSFVYGYLAALVFHKFHKNCCELK